MVQMQVRYTGQLHCEARHAPSGATLATDAPKDNKGRGEQFSPTDLVGAALGSCILTVMGITAQRLGVSIDGAAVTVEKEMTALPTRRIGALTAAVRMPDITDVGHRQALMDAALRCPVKESLHPDIALTITWIWG